MRLTVSRRELHHLLVFVEEKIDKHIQLGTDSSIRAAKQLGPLRKRMMDVMDLIEAHKKTK